MREIGYPPGYIDTEVEDEPSGIIIYGDDEPKHECEDGEIVETTEPGSEEKKMTVAFPGVNAPIPENADEPFTCAGDTHFGLQVHCTTLCGGVLGSYLSAHRKKDGSYHNTYTQEKCVEVEKIFHENQLQSSKDITDLPPILDTVFGRHHGGFERGMGSGWSRRSHQYSGTSDARVEALSTQIQEKDKEMAEKIEQLKEAQKEEIRTLEAKMQAQLQAQAKRFMDVMKVPLSAFDGSSSQGVLQIGFWWRHFGEGCLVEAVWWRFGGGCLVEVVWWRLFGGGCLVEAVWWRLFGGGCLVDAVWWRLFGGGCLVDAVWWRLFGGCCLVEALVDFGAALLGI